MEHTTSESQPQRDSSSAFFVRNRVLPYVRRALWGGSAVVSATTLYFMWSSDDEHQLVRAMAQTPEFAREALFASNLNTIMIRPVATALLVYLFVRAAVELFKEIYKPDSVRGGVLPK